LLARPVFRLDGQLLSLLGGLARALLHQPGLLGFRPRALGF